MGFTIGNKPAGNGVDSAMPLTYIEYTGGTVRATTNTTILRYLTASPNNSGDGATVVDDPEDGWWLVINSPGIWRVTATNRFNDGEAITAIRKNTAPNNTFDLTTEADIYACDASRADTMCNLSAEILCEAGDVIWQSANRTPANQPNHNRIVITGPYPVA